MQLRSSSTLLIEVVFSSGSWPPASDSSVPACMNSVCKPVVGKRELCACWQWTLRSSAPSCGWDEDGTNAQPRVVSRPTDELVGPQKFRWKRSDTGGDRTS